MADIEDLKKRLYKSGEQFSDRPIVSDWQPGRPVVPQMTQQKADEVAQYWQRDIAEKKKNPTKKIILIVSAIIVGLALLGSIFWIFFHNSFDKNKVTIALESPDRVVGGEDVNFVVRYKNNTGVTLEAAKIVFTYPEGSLPSEGQDMAVEKSVDNILAGQAGEVRFKGKLLGQKDDQKNISAVLSYQPKGTSGRFTNSAKAQSTIIAVPITLIFDIPEKIVSGQSVNIALQYTNTSEVDFSNLVLNIEYPIGFKYVSAHPEPTEADNKWSIGNLNANSEGKIILSGVIDGKDGDAKSFGAEIGFDNSSGFAVLAEGVGSATVSVSPLSVYQTINGKPDYLVNPDEKLTYAVNYQNTSNVPISAVNITVEFQTKALDFATIAMKKGTFDSATNKITWTAGSAPELAVLQPGQSGSLDFAVRVLKKMPIKSFSDKNFTIKTIAKIDSPTTPLSLFGTQISGESELEVKIKTKLTLDVKGLFYDPSLPGFGPLPPQIGQTTVFTVRMSVLNTNNDLEDVRVEAILPNEGRVQGLFVPQDAAIKFDQDNKKVTWTIGKVSAGTGEVLPVQSVAWQEAFIPSINQAGKSLPLLGIATITAKDSFTGEDLSVSVLPLTSDKVADILNGSLGRVAK